MGQERQHNRHIAVHHSPGRNLLVKRKHDNFKRNRQNDQHDHKEEVLPFKIIILTSALASVKKEYYDAAKIDGTSSFRVFRKITLPMISPMIFYLVITGFIGAFKAYSDVVAIFGTDLNNAGMNTLVGYIYDMLYGDSGGYPSYASSAAIILFLIVLTVTTINLLVSKKRVHY